MTETNGVDPDWWTGKPNIVEREAVPAGEDPVPAPAAPAQDPDFQVRIRQLTIHPHPNADALELAQVDGFRAIVRKDEFKTGDYALYIPEKAVLPHELLEEIGLVGKLSGSGKNRVKPIRLRGSLSEGIVCRPAAIEAQFAIPALAWTWTTEEVDYAALLGIVKWSPRMPAHLAGKIRPRGNSRILPWISIPNIKKVPGLFRADEYVIATEKIHGTCFLATLDLANGREFMVSSKGVGRQGWDLAEEEGNLYWQAARKFRLEEWLNDASQFFALLNPSRIAIYGEVYGQGIQDLGYGTNVDFRIFDIRVDDVWMSQFIVQNLAAFLAQPEWGYEVKAVPVLFEGTYDYDTLAALAEGKSTLPGADNIREGLVVRSAYERLLPDGSRAIAKFISEAYLTRKGDQTEFE